MCGGRNKRAYATCSDRPVDFGESEVMAVISHLGSHTYFNVKNDHQRKGVSAAYCQMLATKMSMVKIMSSTAPDCNFIRTSQSKL